MEDISTKILGLVTYAMLTVPNVVTLQQIVLLVPLEITY